MIVDGFTPGIVTSRAQPFEYNFELIANVLSNKQQQYNVAYEGLNNLKRQALNIRFLNKSAQQRIDDKNNEIGSYFNNVRDLGDLSNPQIAQNYAKLFESISGDRELITAYHKDNKIQAELAAVEKMRTSADPTKAGYHAMHHETYLRRIQNYMDEDYRSTGEVKPYVPYIDVNKEMAVLMREVPIEKTKDTVRDGQGGLIVTERTGRNPNRVQAKAVEYLQSKAYPQIKEQAEYYFHNTIQDNEDKAYLHGQYQRHIDGQLALLEGQKTDLESRIPSMQGQELVMASQQLAEADQQMASLRAKQMPVEDYLSLDDDELIDHMVQIQMNESVSAYTNTYGGYAESKTYEPDRVTLELMKMQQDQVQFEANYNLDVAELELKRNDAAITASGGANPTNPALPPVSITGGAVNDPTTVDMGSVLSTLNSSHQQIQKELANPLIGVYGEMTIPKLGLMWEGDDIPPGFENNYYMKALQIGMDEARKNGMNKDAGIKFAKEQADRILKTPSTPREVQIYNQYTDAQANQEAMAEFIKQARSSGNVTQYLKDRNMTFGFQYGRTIVDPSLWNSADQKESAATYRNYVWNQVKNNIGFKAPDNNRAEFAKMNYVSDLPVDMITSIENRANGDVTLTFKEEAFAEGSDNKPGGPLRESYVSVKSANGTYEPRKFEGRSITIPVPQMATTEFSKNLGLYVNQKPQTRYAINRDGQAVPFEIYRNSAGTLEYRVNGTKWIDTKYTTPEGLIELIRSHIQNVSNASE